jgi:hypothetical protein
MFFDKKTLLSLGVKIKMSVRHVASYGNYSSVAVNARAVPENEKSSSATSQVSAYGLYSSVSVNARAVPQDENKQVSPYRTISAVAASPRNVLQDASLDTELSPAKRKKPQIARHFDDSSHSTPKPEDLFETGMRAEEPIVIHVPRQTNLESQAFETAKPIDIENEATVNPDQTGDGNTDMISEFVFGTS